MMESNVVSEDRIRIRIRICVHKRCAQAHKEFVVVFKKLLVHTRIHIYISDMRTGTFKEA